MLITTCLHCQTQFRITEKHLSLADGLVVCSQCHKAFQARENLKEIPDDASVILRKSDKTPSQETKSYPRLSDKDFIEQGNPPEPAEPKNQPKPSAPANVNQVSVKNSVTPEPAEPKNQPKPSAPANVNQASVKNSVTPEPAEPKNQPKPSASSNSNQKAVKAEKVEKAEKKENTANKGWFNQLFNRDKPKVEKTASAKAEKTVSQTEKTAPAKAEKAKVGQNAPKGDNKEKTSAKNEQVAPKKAVKKTFWQKLFQSSEAKNPAPKVEKNSAKTVENSVQKPTEKPQLAEKKSGSAETTFQIKTEKIDDEGLLNKVENIDTEDLLNKKVEQTLKIKTPPKVVPSEKPAATPKDTDPRKHINSVGRKPAPPVRNQANETTSWLGGLFKKSSKPEPAKLPEARTQGKTSAIPPSNKTPIIPNVAKHIPEPSKSVPIGEHEFAPVAQTTNVPPTPIAPIAPSVASQNPAPIRPDIPLPSTHRDYFDNRVQHYAPPPPPMVAKDETNWTVATLIALIVLIMQMFYIILQK